MSLKQIAKDKIKEEENIVIGWLATNRVALIINALVGVLSFIVGYRVGH